MDLKDTLPQPAINRMMLTCVQGYVATLPLLVPQLTTLPGGKIVVLADLAFGVLLVTTLVGSAYRLLPLRTSAWLAAVCPLAGVGIATLATRAGLLDVCRVAYSMAVLLFFAHYRLSPHEVVTIARTWVAVAAAVAAAGWLAYIGVAWFGLPANMLAYPNSPNLGEGVVRVASTLGSTTLALYLATAAALALWLMGATSSSRSRRWYGAAAALFLVVSGFTLSRSVIGLAVSLAGLAYLSRDAIPWLWRLRHLTATAAALLIVVGIVATVWAVVPVRLTWGGPTETLRLEANLQKNAYAVIHAAGLRMFRAHPVVGIGPGRFGDHFLQFTTPEERRTSWPPILGPFADPHSSWFGWAAKGGIVALGGWLLLYGWLLGQLLRPHPSGASFTLRHVVAMGLIGFLVNGFHMEITHLKFLWAWLGLGLGARAEVR